MNSRPSGYFAAWIIFGVTQFVTSIILLTIICVISNGHKEFLAIQSDKPDAIKNSQNILKTAILSITLSASVTLFFTIFDNNFIVNWDYNMPSITTFVTSVDGIGTLLWTISKFSFYLVFMYHILYLSEINTNNVTNTKLAKIVTLISGILVIIGGSFVVVSDFKSVDAERELYSVERFGDLKFNNYDDKNDELLMDIASSLIFFVDFGYFIFIVYNYYKVIKSSSSSSTTPSTKKIQIEGVKAITLLFICGASLWIMLTTFTLNGPIGGTLIYIDLMVNDISVFLLLSFNNKSYQILCGLCNRCCLRLCGLNAKDYNELNQTEEDEDNDQDVDSNLL